jgi:hypothetical protein
VPRPSGRALSGRVLQRCRYDLRSSPTAMCGNTHSDRCCAAAARPIAARAAELLPSVLKSDRWGSGDVRDDRQDLRHAGLLVALFSMAFTRSWGLGEIADISMMAVAPGMRARPAAAPAAQRHGGGAELASRLWFLTGADPELDPQAADGRHEPLLDAPAGRSRSRRLPRRRPDGTRHRTAA